MSNKDESSPVSGFVDFDANDTRYAGAAAVVKAELDDLARRRGTDPDKLKGLALSGGGIRSSSFCLGVMQALAKADKLKNFDYLSTVSGGGYIGGSLSWLLLDNWRKDSKCADTVFGTGPDDFPFGTSHRHANPDAAMDKKQASLMRHLRQHGKYLVPGHGITALSFLSVVLRSITMGFVTLIVCSSLLFHLLHEFHAFSSGHLMQTYAMDASLLLVFLYFINLLAYGVLAIINKGKDHALNAYLSRRRWEMQIKYVLIAAITVFVIALTEESRKYLLQLFEGSADLMAAGGSSTIIGALLAWFTQRVKGEKLLKIIPKPVLVNAGLVTMFIGLFILSDQLAYLLHHGDKIGPVHSNLLYQLFLVAVIVMLAWLVPINKISIHRYYRDRLMETFMPDACETFSKERYEARRANSTTLYDCRANKDGKQPYNTMPYHIINCNLILVESNIAKFRGRGGDNFILSPLYSGANATGWRSSDQFADGSITLPTAIAISGAAANSDAGVAGKGLTMNPLLSALMNIFNLRLGYWTVNPNPKYQKHQQANPNYFKPGFRGIVNRDKLNEEADFIQLSDGGHFENLAMYELLRRHCRLIICCDAEQDNNFVFDSLINIINKARIDFGISIDLKNTELEALKYKDSGDGTRYADKGYLVTDINYPDGSKGQLVYIKTTLTENLPTSLLHYKADHPTFPDESTIDQFFDETQFEAYRSLGVHIAQPLIEDESISWG